MPEATEAIHVDTNTSDNSSIDSVVPYPEDNNGVQQDIECDVTTSIVVINVGGVKHETQTSTLKNAPTNLADDAFMHLFYRPETDDYFFDRHPAAFAIVLNYHRTGELHVPKDICGPMMKLELDFWGIDENMIGHCCWNDYCSGKLNRISLEKLEMSRQRENPKKACCLTCWHNFSMKIWDFLEDPYSSRAAMVTFHFFGLGLRSL